MATITWSARLPTQHASEAIIPPVRQVPEHVRILEGAVGQSGGVRPAGQSARDRDDGGVTDSLDLRPEPDTQPLEHRMLGGLGCRDTGAG